VVDDCADTVEALGLMLELWGHQVHAARDGPSALKAAPTFRPQVVLLDIGMPGMDGCQVAGQLRRLPGLPRMLLVAVTGFGRDEDLIRIRAAGFDYHLLKPVEPGALGRLLGQVQAGSLPLNGEPRLP
jgi:two-component system CheB/CheR fusion protein